MVVHMGDGVRLTPPSEVTVTFTHRVLRKGDCHFLVMNVRSGEV